MHLSTLAAAAAVPLLVAAGMYREPVIDLDARAFKQAMAKEHVAMVAFVAPWCGHCQNLAPEFSGAASSLSPLINFYTVDCDVDKNKPLCAEYGIKGFPTIKAFPRGGKGSARDYQGERKRGALVEYAKTLVPDRVKKLRAGESLQTVIDRFRAEKSSLPHALLIHPTAPSIPFLYKVLGHRLSGKALLGFIKDTASHEVVNGLALNEAPAGPRLVVWQPGTEHSAVAEYPGAMKFNPLLEWLEAAITGEIRDAEPEPEVAQSVESKSIHPSADATPSDDAAARRARQKAKLDEAERRDKIRREKLEAQRRTQEQEEQGTPVEEPAAQPAAGVDDEAAPVVPSEDTQPPKHVVPEDAEEPSPVEAPRVQPAEGADDETAGDDSAWESFVQEASEEAHDRDEL